MSRAGARTTSAAHPERSAAKRRGVEGRPRPLLGLALAASLAAASSARAGTPATELAEIAFAPVPPGAERVEIVVRMPPWHFQGAFRATTRSGALADTGTARDSTGFGAPGAAVERVLEGAEGTLTVRLAGADRGKLVPQFMGRWAITGGTGRYAGVRGQGTFASTDVGEAKGSPFDLQILLGHVWREPGGRGHGPRPGASSP